MDRVLMVPIDLSYMGRPFTGEECNIYGFWKIYFEIIKLMIQ